MVSTKTATRSIDNNKSAFYAKHIKEWQKSGLSQKKYCKSVNISYPAFVYWRVKFLEQDNSPFKEQRCLKSKTVQEKDPVFTQIKIKESTALKHAAVRTGLSDSLVLIMPNGIEIMVPVTIDDQRLVSLAQSLGGAVC